MEIIQSIIFYILSLDGFVFAPLINMLIILVCGGGIQNALRSGISMGMGLIGINLLMSNTIQYLTPVAELLSERLGLEKPIIDLGYGAVNGAAFWPGFLIITFGVIVLDIILVFFKLTDTLWTDMHNTWHTNFVGLLVYIASGSLIWGLAAALITFIITLKLSDYHANVIQEFNGMPNVTCIATSATLPATFSKLVMKVIERIPGLDKINLTPEHIKDKFGIFGENMTVGALLGIVLGLLSGYGFKDTSALAIVLAATLGLFPKMAGVLVEGIVPLSTTLMKFMKSKFPGRRLHIAADPAVLLGHPSVMATVILMFPISVVLTIVLPPVGFIAIASLTCLPYWIGAMVPYTKGNILYTVIVASLWIVLTSVLATQLAPFVTQSLNVAGFFTEEIAAGGQFTCWDEGGNIIAWIIVKIQSLF